MVLVVLAILSAAGLLGLGAPPSPSSSASEVNPQSRTPTQPELMPGRIAIGEHIPPGVFVGPELPAAIDLTPTDVPWLSGNTVIVAGPEGANLRPYPVADDNLAPPSIGLAQGTQVQIISTFRLRMSDGDWWYVRVPGAADSVGPSFGWLREDLLQSPGT
jgi:hypothetical protein